MKYSRPLAALIVAAALPMATACSSFQRNASSDSSTDGVITVSITDDTCEVSTTIFT